MADRPASTLRRISAFSYTVETHRARHRIDFRFDQFSGRIVITVDGSPVVETRLGFRSAFRLTRSFAFDLGESGHRVVIEARRKVSLAWLRPLRYRILIDDQHVTSLES